MTMLGGWDISELKCCNLPQKAASAFTGATADLVGVDYEPVLYVGSQVVNGTNYCILAVQTLLTAQPKKRLVKLIIHESLHAEYKLHSVSVINLRE